MSWREGSSRRRTRSNVSVAVAAGWVETMLRGCSAFARVGERGAVDHERDGADGASVSRRRSRGPDTEEMLARARSFRACRRHIARPGRGAAAARPTTADAQAARRVRAAISPLSSPPRSSFSSPFYTVCPLFSTPPPPPPPPPLSSPLPPPPIVLFITHTVYPAFTTTTATTTTTYALNAAAQARRPLPSTVHDGRPATGGSSVRGGAAAGPALTGPPHAAAAGPTDGGDDGEGDDDGEGVGDDGEGEGEDGGDALRTVGASTASRRDHRP